MFGNAHSPKIFPEIIYITQTNDPAGNSHCIKIGRHEVVIKHARWEPLVKKAYEIGYNYGNIQGLEREESDLKDEVKQMESDLSLLGALFSDNPQMITAGDGNGDESR